MRSVVAPALSLGRGPVARSSMHSLAIRLAGVAISFVQAALAARLLGAEGYGAAAVVLSVVQVAAILSLFGWGPLAVRELARQGRAAGATDFIRTSALWVTGLSVLAGCALAAAAFSGLIEAPYRGALLASGLVVLPMALLQLQRGIAQGLGRVVVAQVPGELLRPGLLVAFLGTATMAHWPVDAQSYVTAFAVSAFAAIALALLSTTRGLPWTGVVRDPMQHRRWRSEAVPFLGITLLVILLGEVTTLMLGWLATAHAAGLFQPVARIVPLMVLPAQVVAVAFAPRIAELWARGERARVVRLTHTFTLVTSAMTIGLVGLLVLAAPLIMRVFGPDFVPSASLLWIVGLAQVANAAAGPVGHLLTMTGHAPVALRGQLAALAANVLLGVTLIPAHGAQGAAIAMAAGLAVWNLVLLVRTRALLDFDPSLVGALIRVLSQRH